MIKKKDVFKIQRNTKSPLQQAKAQPQASALFSNFTLQPQNTNGGMSFEIGAGQFGLNGQNGFLNMGGGNQNHSIMNYLRGMKEKPKNEGTMPEINFMQNRFNNFS